MSKKRPARQSAALCGLVIASIATLSPVTASATDWTNVTLTDIEEQLVPKQKLGSGDREFGGHGPDITASVRLAISADRRKLEATVSFRAKETQHDWSETKGEWKRTVYTAPAGKKIKDLLGTLDERGGFVAPTPCPGAAANTCLVSQVAFRSQSAGFQILGSTSDFKEFVHTLGEIVATACEAFGEEDLKRQCRDWKQRIKEGTAVLQESQNHVHLVDADNGGPVRVFAIVGDTGGPDISEDDNGKDDTRINAIKFQRVRLRLQPA